MLLEDANAINQIALNWLVNGYLGNRDERFKLFQSLHVVVLSLFGLNMRRYRYELVVCGCSLSLLVLW